MATLSLQHIDKIYPNHVQAVYDFNLEVKDKEFIVFVGPSGCGKSTTLRMIAGFEPISSGRFYIDGVYMNNVEPKDRNIAMVFQNYALYPHMTVYENLKFALELRKLSCPIYQESAEISSLKEQEKPIRKEIKKVVSLFTKNQNSHTLLTQYTELYRRLFAIEDQIQSLYQPVVGIDHDEIKRLKKDIESLAKDIAYAERKMNRHQEEEVQTRGQELIEQKRIQIQEAKLRIDYLEHNEVPLTEFRHLSQEEMDIRINRVASSIDLTRYLFRLPSALSGGQRQRVALGRAIVRQPKVFLMDEPLSNLDAKLRVQTRGEIIKIHKQVGATTIYVTHDQTEAMTMADRIVCMKDGKIQQTGTPEELYNDPANRFVASFIGSPAMNFFEGIYRDGKFIFASAPETALELNEANQKLLHSYQGKTITLGVRPEHIHLGADGPMTDLSNPFSAKLDYFELLGSEYNVYGLLGSQPFVLKTEKKIDAESGAPLSLRFDQNKLYFFEKESADEVRINAKEVSNE